MKSLPDWSIVFIWFILSLSIFYSGHLYSNDTVSKIESARNLIKHGSFEVSGYNGAWGVVGRDGKTYPHFSLGSILVMVPPVLLYETLSAITGKPLPKFVQSVFVSGFNLLYTALSGCFFFIILIQLGKSKRDAFIYANIIIFCSELLQYSSTGWSEPAALCWALLGFIFLLRDTTVKRQWVLWAVCAFIASLIRIEYIVFFLCLLFVTLLKNRAEWRTYITPLVIVCSVVLAHMWFNYFRFESVFNFGYFGRDTGENASIIASGATSVFEVVCRFFSRSYLINVYRTYISFGRVHWFWICPLLALLPFAIHYKKYPLLVKQIVIAAGIAQFAIMAMGSNSWCWANRYLYTTFPFLLLPVFFIPIEKKKLLIAFKLLSVIGFIVSLLSTLVNYHTIQEILVNKYGYYKAMYIYSTNTLKAPFWLHIKMLPKQFINTLSLFTKGNNLPPWEALRVECFDLWPVSMCGVGINSFLSFGLWLALLVTSIGFGVKVVVPRFITNDNI